MENQNQKQELPGHVVRMQQEFEELNTRVVSLHNFINSDSYMSLGPVDRRLLELQFASMVQYQFFLEQRLHIAFQSIAQQSPAAAE